MLSVFKNALVIGLICDAVRGKVLAISAGYHGDKRRWRDVRVVGERAAGPWRWNSALIFGSKVSCG